MTWNQDTIKALRAEQGWSQVQLATILDVSPSSITNWERGIETPKPHMARLLDELREALADAANEDWTAVPGMNVRGEPRLARVREESGNLLVQICSEREGLCIPLTEILVPSLP